MTSELIRYINQYGGFCRDCADNDGICPTSGMPCDPKSTNAVIKHTLAALEYGIKHGFIENPFARTAPDVPELVQQKPTDERCLETELEAAELKLAELEMQLELKTDECAQLANSLDGSEHLRKAAEADNKRLREALEELAILMQDVIDGKYIPDSFTLQPARAALEGVGHEQQ